MPYLCVSGNTGAGKSTLLAVLGKAIAGRGWRTDIADESSMHHPLLQRQFDDPARWGFLMQINFVVQRVARIMHGGLDDGTIMIMERSPSEDPLFFERLRMRGYIGSDLETPYYALAGALHRQIQEPLGYIYLRTPPAICLHRLVVAMQTGARPVELEGRALAEYVHDMDERYARWRADLPADVNIYDLPSDDFDGPGEDEIEKCLSAVERWLVR